MRSTKLQVLSCFACRRNIACRGGDRPQLCSQAITRVVACLLPYEISVLLVYVKACTFRHDTDAGEWILDVQWIDLVPMAVRHRIIAKVAHHI